MKNPVKKPLSLVIPSVIDILDDDTEKVKKSSVV